MNVKLEIDGKTIDLEPIMLEAQKAKQAADEREAYPQRWRSVEQAIEEFMGERFKKITLTQAQVDMIFARARAIHQELRPNDPLPESERIANLKKIMLDVFDMNSFPSTQTRYLLPKE